MSKIIAILLSLTYASILSAQPAFHTSPACWAEPRIYSEIRDNGPELYVQRVDGDIPQDSLLSPNRAYAFFLKEEAVPESGASRVELTIYNERPYMLRILLPKIRGVGQIQWINEHLIFLRIWWGRLAGTDYIIDVEREEISNQQAFRYGAIAFQQFKQCEAPEWSNSEGCSCYSGAPAGWKPQAPLPTDKLPEIGSRIRVSSPQLEPGWHVAMLNRTRVEPICYRILIFESSGTIKTMLTLKEITRIQVSSIYNKGFTGNYNPTIPLYSDEGWFDVSLKVLRSEDKCSQEMLGNKSQ